LRMASMPHGSQPVFDEEYVPPRTPLEETLAGIWAEVLGVDLVGVHDDFFDLGGHSLLAVRVISRIRQSFDVEVPVHAVFTHPRVASLSEAVEDAVRQKISAMTDAEVAAALEAEGGGGQG
jgi:acyl carrier protein